ncbi:hypothetical protein [Corynebacterium sp. p3-SID1194]|uniref:hypothetical protein n=1 Tax=Corynebacterium sp. p3-SID1194 TaxID=2916105 RepID=UPI0021A5021B|nr:hypothetical protein [Corynebacterium sp. p3-SID1194]MCT1450632.1 hypothetical protein [Corynebacterium sp. p3-SID1194]
MSWFRVDDQLDANKKVKSIPRRMRAKALGLWVQAGAWCARELTDGHVPKYMLEDFAVTPAVAQALVDADMWEKVNDGWKFVHWDEFNPSSTNVRARRAAARKRQAEFREKKKQERENARASEDEEMSRRDNGVSNGVSNAATNGGVTAPRPDPTRPDHINKGREEPYGSSETGDQTPPEEFVGSLDELAARQFRREKAPGVYGSPEDPRCADHVALVTAPQCRACARARAWFEENAAAEIESARAQRRATIDACDLCDDNGIRTVAGGATRCDHTPEDDDLPPWEKHA